jgi:tape measure domain-containing protein
MATTIGTIELIAKIDTSSYKSGAKEIERSNKDIEDSAEKASDGIGKHFTTGAKIATAAILGIAAVTAKSFINSASDIQSLRASFESLTGNVDDTNTVMSSLYDLGKKTAFSNKDIQTAGRNYLAAGVSVDKLNDVLSYTADIAGATGADLGQLTLPLTQTIARGKLQTQDFYQILNSGAGALRKPLTDLAGKKGFGSLAEAMENGAITSDDLLTVMQDVTKEGGFAFKGAIKQSETFNGRMSNLKEAVTNFGLSLLGVDAITGTINPDGVFARLSSAITLATNFLSQHGEMIKQVGTVIAILLTPAIIMLGVQGLLAGARLAAGILLALGPIGLIIAAVAAAAYLIVQNWDWVKDKAIMAWDWIKGAAMGVFDWLKNNWPLILAIITGPIGLAVLAIIRNFDKIKSVVGGIMDWIRGGFGKIADIGTSIIKGAVNSVLGFAEGTINGFIRLINGAIGAINKLPGVNIGTIGELSIPKLAKGGIVSSPTLAMIGEGTQPEAVIPLSKLDAMIKSGSASGSGSSSNTQVVVNLTHSKGAMREAALDTIRLVNEVYRAKGIPQIGVTQ